MCAMLRKLLDSNDMRGLRSRRYDSACHLIRLLWQGSTLIQSKTEGLQLTAAEWSHRLIFANSIRRHQTV